jgi:D-alanine--poly(phosphoribitol) ligase subunit 1
MELRNNSILIPESEFKISRQLLVGLETTHQDRFMRFGLGSTERPRFDHLFKAFQATCSQYSKLSAVRCSDQSMTYQELSNQVEYWARVLTEQGVRRGDKVGLFLERSMEMVVGIFAILKLGAVYVPQDARIVPVESLRHVTNTAEIKIILTIEKFQVALARQMPKPVKTIALTENFDRKAGIEQIAPSLQTDDVCFVLFTSGTTGKPNGVEVTHKNLCNILLTAPGHLQMGPGKKVSQILNIGFDMAAWEILGALTQGAELLIRGSDIGVTVAEADIVIATPSVLAGIDYEKCRQVQVVAVAGEPCPLPLAQKWGQTAQFYNCCGPTEVTIVNTMHEFNPQSGLSIGKPTPNNTVYVLDDHLNPLPIGEVGEMWAGGDCVSQGYINNPELTEARYKPDPFLGGGRMMFRTRDLGRWNERGELEHLGRTDDQVKVRGFRVELDSVSKALEKVPGCEQAVTIKLDERNLVSFVTGRNFVSAVVNGILEKLLPYYAIPCEVFVIPELPRTDRGKIDKRYLFNQALTLRAR